MKTRVMEKWGIAFQLAIVNYFSFYNIFDRIDGDIFSLFFFQCLYVFKKIFQGILNTAKFGVDHNRSQILYNQAARCRIANPVYECFFKHRNRSCVATRLP